MALPISPRKVVIGFRSDRFRREIEQMRPVSFVGHVNDEVVGQAVKWVYATDTAQSRFIDNRMGKQRWLTLQQRLRDSLNKDRIITSDENVLLDIIFGLPAKSTVELCDAGASRRADLKRAAADGKTLSASGAKARLAIGTQTLSGGRQVDAREERAARIVVSWSFVSIARVPDEARHEDQRCWRVARGRGLHRELSGGLRQRLRRVAAIQAERLERMHQSYLRGWPDADFRSGNRGRRGFRRLLSARRGLGGLRPASRRLRPSGSGGEAPSGARELRECPGEKAPRSVLHGGRLLRAFRRGQRPHRRGKGRDDVAGQRLFRMRRLLRLRGEMLGRRESGHDFAA